MGQQTLDKDTFVGFGLQEEQGEPILAGLHWVPLIDQGEDLRRDPHRQPVLQISRTNALAGMWDAFTSWEGPLAVPIIPGAAYVADLLKWMTADPVADRDAQRQAKFASVIVRRGPGYTGRAKLVSDVKVARATWSVPQNGHVGVRLDLVAIGQPFEDAEEPPAVPAGESYRYNELTCQMVVDIPGGAEIIALGEMDLEHFEWTLDQKVHSAAEGCRLKTGQWPAELRNKLWPECSGRFLRGSRDNILRDAYYEGHDIEINLTLARDANAISADLYRCQLLAGTRDPTGGRGEGRHVDEFVFRTQPSAAQQKRSFLIAQN